MLTSNINPYDSNSKPQTTAQSDARTQHLHKKCKSEDLHILAHAQGQLREHLEPPERQTYQHQKQNQNQTQEQSSQWLQDLDINAQPQSSHQYQPHTHLHQSTGSRPRSAHQSRPAFLNPYQTKPDLRNPVTHLPFRWWETGVLDDDDIENNEIRQSIERDPNPEESIVESIEIDDCISPGTQSYSLNHRSVAESGIGGSVKTEEGDEDEEARLWDEAQRNWNGYVKHKESWVRRAGLKRERDGAAERHSLQKRGRLGE